MKTTQQPSKNVSQLLNLSGSHLELRVMSMQRKNGFKLSKQSKTI